MKLENLTRHHTGTAVRLLIAGFSFLAIAASPQNPAAAGRTNAAVQQVEAATNELATSEQPGINRDALVVFGKNAQLNENDTADTVVVIGGSAKIRGQVRDTVVVIGGDADIDGEVGQDAVAVLGNIHLGPHAAIHQDVVTVGGKAEVAPGAFIQGHVQEVNIGGIRFFDFNWLKQWLVHCVFKLRPLAPQVGWVWAVAGAFCLIYLLAAIAFPKPVQLCTDQLTDRPATTFLVGLAVKFLVPLLMLVLALTGIGLFVVPFLYAAILFGSIVGKVALLEYVGASMGRQLGLDFLRRPLPAFLVGIGLLTVFYIVPVLGFLAYGLFGFWGLGVAITTVFARVRSERRQNPPPQPLPPQPVPPVENAGAGDPPAPAASLSGTAFARIPLAGPTAAAAPKAGFWERMGAAFLDLVLICVPGIYLGPFILVVALAYFAGMWTWKGTTIGGIVLKLQVVRYDGGPVTFPVAFVRGLAAGFSVLALFLGFFWIGWDPDKQGWHDKIAGTVVVRLPQSMPLVCL